ncbi:MAG: hypothetical protein ACFFCO_05375 [Promethearchaeota archaeon]
MQRESVVLIGCGPISSRMGAFGHLTQNNTQYTEHYRLRSIALLSLLSHVVL